MVLPHPLRLQRGLPVGMTIHTPLSQTKLRLRETGPPTLSTNILLYPNSSIPRHGKQVSCDGLGGKGQGSKVIARPGQRASSLCPHYTSPIVGSHTQDGWKIGVERPRNKNPRCWVMGVRRPLFFPSECLSGPWGHKENQGPSLLRTHTHVRTVVVCW